MIKPGGVLPVRLRRRRELKSGLTAYEIYGNKSANTVDWLGNAINVQYMMSRYWANNSAEAATECGGG